MAASVAIKIAPKNFVRINPLPFLVVVYMDGRAELNTPFRQLSARHLQWAPREVIWLRALNIMADAKAK
jgi:hypothetical protein